MKEEMEDGHFDREGFYHFKKESNIKDAWLDDIDWIKVIIFLLVLYVEYFNT